ncbi:MAG TPA: hypothetical protein VFX50_18110, partial [Gemmatimonadales bacterium]|nr:hypothetical protein [Gemmatimonadales bacterium]
MAQPPVQPSSRRVHRGVVGLVPAAGSATRLGPLPCSKEVLPLPAFGDATAHDGHTAVRPAIAHLLDCFVEGGVTRAFVVVRDDKWDVPRALRASGCGVDLAYVVVGETPSPVHTLARAAPFVRDQVVALGFPDILFAPRHAYGPLLDRLLSGTADVVLGLFPTEQCDKTDMVELADFSEATGGGVAVVRDLVIKQPPRGLRYTWSIACWRPRFTEVL